MYFTINIIYLDDKLYKTKKAGGNSRIVSKSSISVSLHVYAKAIRF